MGAWNGQGPDWGHFVSSDLLHWARLPVAIWNDHWYDWDAVYTGSTTLVDGRPVVVYPGKCSGATGAGATDACDEEFTYSVAVPANNSDPLLTNWTKPSYNPILNHTGDDPSTAWRTSSGEWRMIGNYVGSPSGNESWCDGVAPIYGSTDFRRWYKVGCTDLLQGDCPTLFPLPRLTPGSEVGLTAQALAAMPTHVHKAGTAGDHARVGTWVDGAPGPEGVGTPGTWAQHGEAHRLDSGRIHASKDFWDPRGEGRRVLWTWVMLTGGLQTVPRELTYDPRIARVVSAPVEELRRLRAPSPTARLARTGIVAGAPAAVLHTGAASDVELYWGLPAGPATLVITIGAEGAQPAEISIEFAPPGLGAANATVTFSPEGGTDVLPLLATDAALSLRLLIDTINLQY